MSLHRHGPRITDEGVEFRVWAPDHARVTVVLFESPERERARMPMRKDADGFHRALCRDARAGALYAFAIGAGKPFPDPASRAQPFGVHGPSRVVDARAFRWSDDTFRAPTLDELVVYELHVGTATRAGTFRALVEVLDRIVEVGVNAIEVMPIADFAGDRNWGYDGVALFAPARCYGSPEDFAFFVDEAHRRGLAVILDVVYNHVGPDGAYLRAFSGRYFADRHHTPWGQGWNYDGPDSAPVRDFVLENVEQWVRDYHVDGLRLDATHAIADDGEPHLLTAISERAHTCGGSRVVHVIAEDERNEARLLRPPPSGLGLDAVWADDFHHEVRRIVAGDDEAYFSDYRGDVDELSTILERGWLYEGQPAKSHGGKPRGTPARDLAPARFVHCIQNHDQIGNRAYGDRLRESTDVRRRRAAAALLLTSPYTPMLFMGQEFDASSPFAYFTDHHAELGRLVTEGRRGEFGKFRAFADPAARKKIPDPQARETFERSKLEWEEATREPGRSMRALYRDLLRLRRRHPALRARDRNHFAVTTHDGLLVLQRRSSDDAVELRVVVGLARGGSLDFDGDWHVVLDSEDVAYGGARRATFVGRTLTLDGPGAVVLSSRAEERAR